MGPTAKGRAGEEGRNGKERKRRGSERKGRKWKEGERPDPQIFQPRTNAPCGLGSVVE